MKFKKIAIVLFMFFPVFVFPAEKWNIVMANLRDLSVRKDKNIGVVIYKSIAGQFQRQKGFNFVSTKNTNVEIPNFKAALEFGRATKADVIVYGDYYVDGEDLVVVMDVFDLLENKLKMRKYYSGEATLDIFDTIDSMAADLVVKIKEVLPELTEESATRVRQIRQNVYEKEEITVKRMFYTRLGFHTEMGPKFIGWNSSSPTNHMEYNHGDMPFSNIPIGFSLRYWELRVDFMISGLPGIPSVDWDYMTNTHDAFPSSANYWSLSYYLPWLGNTLAVGLGMMFPNIIQNHHLEYDMNKHWINSTMDFGSVFCMNLLWNPDKNWEVSLYIAPFMAYFREDRNTDFAGNLSGYRQKAISYFVPMMNLGAMYFIGPVGLELRLYAADFEYTETEFDTNRQNPRLEYYSRSTLAAFYVGLVYKIDFLEDEKKQ